MTLTIHTDGGSRGNPGQAAIGVVVFQDGTTIAELKQTIGVATNNEAEYQAVLHSLEWLANHQFSESPTEVLWKLDSKLVVEQLSKNWKIKEPRMMDLAQKCWQALNALRMQHRFIHVPRAENKEADALVNQALDQLT
ncbi:MAG: ribonuclease [Patescibacteria group bacterium]|nr:ribonuclease [Patescibacteria group bacterium]